MNSRYLALTVLITVGLCSNVSTDISSNERELAAFKLVKKGLIRYRDTLRPPTYLGQALNNFHLPGAFRSKLDATKNSYACDLCPIVADIGIFLRRSGVSTSVISNSIIFLCSALRVETHRVCQGFIEANIEIFMSVIDNKKNLKGERFCELVFQSEECGYSSEADNDWSVEIPNGQTVKKAKSNATTFFNVLHMSDFHYDPYYKPGKTNKCGEPLCCQDDQEDASSESNACGYWSDYNTADTPLHTIKAFLEQIKNHDFDYVYFTGDIISHKVWATSINNNTRDITFISQLLRDHFTVPVFPILGNHEPHPLNVFSYESVDGQESTSFWLYDLIAEEWGGWLDNEAKKTLKLGGFYTFSPKKGFRIVALNSNVCYVYNWWLLLDSNDPYGQLKWLVKVLIEAEDKGENVHILSHVPTGQKECLKTWSREYRRILERFSNTVTAQFNGHTHTDEMIVYYSKENPSKAINVAFNGASITTYDAANPSYKLFQVDPITYDVVDYEEWTFNLTLANFKSDAIIDWYKLYSFKDAYGVTNLQPEEINRLVHRMTNYTFLIDQYKNFRYKETDAIINSDCNTRCHKELLCNIVTSEVNDNSKCDYFSNLYDANK